jgi:putative serine protease PepD
MERRSRGWFQTILAGVIGAVLAVTAVQVIDDDPATTAADLDPTATPVAASDSEEPTQPPATFGIGSAAAGDAVAIGAAVIPSIVTVQVGSQSGGGIVGTGSGSGVIVDAEGYIVTNEHVVSVGSAFEVVLSDGRTTYEATLVGADPLTDLAVLKIDAAGLTPIAIGDTSVLQVGDPTVAVGSPLGLQGGPSLTVGVVSAFDRIVEAGGSDPLYGMLQTDAPITQGSSGGALVDGLGRLIGITTAVGVSEVGVEGIGFATPVELMTRVTDELIATGTVSHAFLGIFGGTIFSTAADGARIASGVEVSSVEPDSAAIAAGLSTGDIITAVDGEPVTTMEDLIMTLRYMAGGDAVTLTIDAPSGPTDRDVVLGTRP